MYRVFWIPGLPQKVKRSFGSGATANAPADRRCSSIDWKSGLWYFGVAVQVSRREEIPRESGSNPEQARRCAADVGSAPGRHSGPSWIRIRARFFCPENVMHKQSAATLDSRTTLVLALFGNNGWIVLLQDGLQHLS